MKFIRNTISVKRTNLYLYEQHISFILKYLIQQEFEKRKTRIPFNWNLLEHLQINKSLLKSKLFESNY